MLKIATSIFSLLFGTAMLLLGIGLQGTLLSLRAVLEDFSITVTGLVMSSYFIGYVVGSYYCPPLIKKIGHIRAYAAMATIASATAIAHALLPEPWVWALLRFITGMCLVGLYMIIESWLNAIAPNSHRGQFFSIYMLITLLAMAGGQQLLQLADIAGFELFAISTILISLALVPITMTRIHQPVIADDHSRLSLRQLYRSTHLGVIGTLSAGLVMGVFWGLMPVYYKDQGFEDGAVAMVMTFTILGGALLQWPIGLLSDYMDRRIILAVSALASATLVLLNYLFGGLSTMLLYGIAFLFGGFAFSIYSLSVAYVNDRLDPEQSLEGTRGLLQVYGVSAVIGPLLVGWGMGTLGPSVLLLFFFVVLGILGLFTVKRILTRDPVPMEEQGEFVPMSRTSEVVLDSFSEDEADETEPDDTLMSSRRISASDR
jgi:MFS family permease